MDMDKNIKKSKEPKNNPQVDLTSSQIMPALPMRGLVIFPRMILHFDVGREKSIQALKAAATGDRKIFLAAQKDSSVPEPLFNEIYKTGVIAEVRQILKTPDNTTRVLVEGICKAKAVSFESTEPFIKCEVVPINPRKITLGDSEETALLRMLKNSFKSYSSLAPKMPTELYESIMSEKSLDRLFDLIVFNVYLRVEDKQKLLELTNLKRCIESLIGIMENEISVMELEMEIHEQVRDSIDKNQREYYLREQMRVLSKQLGNSDEPDEECYGYIEEIESLGFEPEVEEKLIKEAEKLMKLSPNSQESGVIRTYLDAVLDMPWKTFTKDKTDLVKAEKQLNKDHYGLKKVKERILELIAVRALQPDIKGQIICLVGPPGVGKTSVGKSIAKSLNKKYARISLGGVRDEAEIRGHRKTYIGAMPGRIINALKQAKSMNPVILLDEIDKLGSDYKGDPSSAMLEVLDMEQNSSFVDHYFEIPVDLSKVLFITTANTTDTIPDPLLDRMEVIELGSYTREEKFHIAKEHLIPKQLEKHGEKASILKITDSAIYSVIDSYTREAGVRRLEQKIAAICRKSAKRLVAGEKKVTVTDSNITEFLGIKKYTPELLEKQDEVGIVNGLAWTSVGGVLMPLEVIVMEGTGKIEITGSLGDVMTESSRIAVSLVRMLAARYGIDPDFYKNKDLHIHAPEGAVPKNGPSAGVTMTSALISALSGIAVRRDVAMTGEITLHGKVLPIGGLKEKTMAAYKAGVKTVVIPKENEPDIEELDDVVKSGLRFVIAEDIKTVLETALVKTNIAPFNADSNPNSNSKNNNNTLNNPVIQDIGEKNDNVSVNVN
ncbi:atp dependent lon protease family member [Holotrichia oblita]|nr:atp dependent lon protease family member [Holotrichia oblita]